jgi:ZIP family zinc transporter
MIFNGYRRENLRITSTKKMVLFREMARIFPLMHRVRQMRKGAAAMDHPLFFTISLPFFGTAIGAALVFFLRGNLHLRLEQSLSGFAAGVMTAASVWSLLIPALERSEHLGKWAFLPAVSGIWCGVLFLRLLDRLIPWLQRGDEVGSRQRLMVLAVTLHNLPEGMAVGAAAAAFLAGEGIPFAAVLTLSLGIAIQDLPEGAIISLPLCSGGIGKGKAFLYGTASGFVEPLGAIGTILLAHLAVPILPFLLSFSAGAMVYVVVQELIPDMHSSHAPNSATLFFTAGFTLMMLLDLVLG